MMAVGWLLGACTADDDAMQGGRDVPIRLGIALTEPSGANVRATTRTASSYQNTELIAGAPVDVYIKDTGTGSMVANPVQCTVSGASGDLTYDGNLYYPASGADVSIYAIHPCVASGSAFAVSADQTSDANYAASDLIFSKSANYHYSNSAQTLPMAHLMSQIVVNITLPSAWAGRAITNLKLHAKRTATITYPVNNINGYTLGEASGSVETISMSEGGAAVIPPQTITSGSTFITFHVAGVGPYAYALPSNTTFAPGHRYVYTITPKSAELSYAQTVVSKLLVGGTFVNPITNTGNGQVVYSSSNTSVATVNSATGVVTPVAVGSTTITATTVNGINNYYSTTNASYNLDIVKIPIEYIAPYNMKTATTMATANTKAQSGYFCWKDTTAESGGVGTPSDWSKAKPNIQAMIKGTAVAGYHLPSKAEWCSVVAPYYAGSNDSSMGGSDSQRITYKRGWSSNLSETVAWGVTNNNGTYSYAVNQVFYNDYNCPDDADHTYIGYGLRFKELSGGNYVNGQYTCAYRYEYKSADASVGEGASLTIQVKYVGTNTSITISTISNESWWTSPDFTVVLPACGYSHYSNGSDQKAGWSSASYTAYGYYWSATARDASRVHYMFFYTSYVDGNNRSQPGSGLSVRLFKDR